MCTDHMHDVNTWPDSDRSTFSILYDITKKNILASYVVPNLIMSTIVLPSSCHYGCHCSELWTIENNILNVVHSSLTTAIEHVYVHDIHDIQVWMHFLFDA